ncbi:MAG: RNA-binding transcriptional accessory protein [Magnetococcales bacterium]|nr:RNA-binding transcriptional accessory protein [Magnetococcales bacterium]
MPGIPHKIAVELAVQESQVVAAIALLDEGATVPFIARYRKEVTQNLTDTHLRHIHERLVQLRELEERRTTILESLRKGDKLTPELERALLEAQTRTRLEDLYFPFRPRRQTKAALAMEAGLGPLADRLLRDPTVHPDQAATAFIHPELGIADGASALEGAREILMERIAESPAATGELRTVLWEKGIVQSKVVKGQEEKGAKFADYFAASEPLRKIPPHRALALLRGQEEGILRLSLDHEEELTQPVREPVACLAILAHHAGIRDQKRPADGWLQETLRLTWRKKVKPRLETDLMKQLTDQAHDEAIRVFARNLKELLLAAPAGMVPVIGLDPGVRTGVKLAVVDATGKVVATDTLYPHAPRHAWRESQARLAELARRHAVQLVSIGNGTASRETERLVVELAKAMPELSLRPVVVSEAGASVYSASEYAALELPELDVTLRGAVSIARRLQDPLAELVKTDPKSIGVGQYQHDLHPKRLAAALDGVVEDAVNAVGVDVNTASVPLLERVSGLNKTLARNIVAQRDAKGAFPSRLALLSVPRFGPKAFEQAAGFLRIRNGATPLDASAVHPESYPVVERIVKRVGLEITRLIGNTTILKTLAPREFVDGRFGEPTVRDILAELEKPGRDPRPEFRTAAFQAGVESPEDLTVGMILEGVVSNVTNFGAFVDIGVHQDGLVHISAMAHHFVKDPHAIVKAGDIIQVRVVEIDLTRRRIALSMRLDDTPAPVVTPQPKGQTKPATTPPTQPQADSAMAAAFSRLRAKFPQ